LYDWRWRNPHSIRGECGERIPGGSQRLRERPSVGFPLFWGFGRRPPERGSGPRLEGRGGVVIFGIQDPGGRVKGLLNAYSPPPPEVGGVWPGWHGGCWLGPSPT